MTTKAVIAACLNSLSAFLAQADLDSVDAVNNFWNTLSKESSNAEQNSEEITDVIVLCASQVLRPAEIVFNALWGIGSEPRLKPTSNLVLILCGGIGHSTELIYHAVSDHPQYKVYASEIKGLPEARVLQNLGERCFGLPAPLTLDDASNPKKSSAVRVLVEDRSTNCGANASESRALLEAHGIRNPRSIVVMQDPTMSRRTVASFLKTYNDLGPVTPVIRAWPTFIPTVCATNRDVSLRPENGLYHSFDFTVPEIDEMELWIMDRFVDLVIGEIPRLRDDADGYGPRGRGFIGHVEIPIDIEQAWGIMTLAMEKNGRKAPIRY